MIKMVVTDVDGTLVKEGTLNINPEYYDVIRALNEKGIKVVLASGRQYESIRKLIEPVQDLVWYIADGGGTIKMEQGLETVGEIPKPWIEKCWKDISNIPGVEGMLCSSTKSYVPLKDTNLYNCLVYDYKYNVECLNGWDNLPNEPINKVTLYRTTEIERYADKYFIPKWEGKLHMSVAGEWWLDCVMPGVNKGTALQKMMDCLDIKAEEVLATGDNPNDLEMIKLAGTGLAVATAHPKVKEEANGIIPSYEEDGVLGEWKKLL